jgi:hypothetical protein
VALVQMVRGVGMIAGRDTRRGVEVEGDW